MTKDEAMRLALDALENAPIEYDFHGNPMDAEFGEQRKTAIAALHQALAQPEQKPVAWLDSDGFPWSEEGIKSRSFNDVYTPLYTHPMPEPAAPEPVAIGEYLGAKKDDCGEREECVTWKPIEAGTPLYTTPPSLQSAQPVDYLCDGARFKLSFDEKGKTHMLSGFKAELQGQWVALVDATDNRHMKAVAPVTAPQREWVELEDDEVTEIADRCIDVFGLADLISEALRTKNEGKNT